MVKLPIYMDNHATTPLDPRVLDLFATLIADNAPFIVDRRDVIPAAVEQIGGKIICRR